MDLLHKPSEKIFPNINDKYAKKLLKSDNWSQVVKRESAKPSEDVGKADIADTPKEIKQVNTELENKPSDIEKLKADGEVLEDKPKRRRRKKAE